MLTELTISNLATIDALHLELSAGTTVVTGETGAGKSILIDAIELVLGERAASEMVRQGQEKAEIHARFCIEKLDDVKNWLQENDVEHALGECIIRRTLFADGRSRSYINGMPTTLQLLRELSHLLVNTHAQHEHQALFKHHVQRNILDQFAGHRDLVDEVAKLAATRQSLLNNLNQLRRSSHDGLARSQFLQFQLQELHALHLQPDEFSSLEIEHKQLAHASELLHNIHTALDKLSENEEQNVVHLLSQIIDTLESIQTIHPKISSWIDTIKSATIQLNDVENELKHHLETVDIDPERLHIVESKISALFEAARKHKTTPDQLLALQHAIETELNMGASHDGQIKQLEQQLLDVEKQYQLHASKLSDSRGLSAKKLQQEITHIIHQLALPHGQFQIDLIAEEKHTYASHGLEKIIFHISTNVGQPLQPLAKVASGGELSRISLAIYMATAEQHTIPTLIFDEVDVGISGGTAEMVGKLLRRLGNNHQLICITHLPQVAAQGHWHLLVEKHHDKNATFTHIRQLTQQDKVKELARMLGGVKITNTTLAHAMEMLEKA